MQSIKKGDLIYITAPAKAIDADCVHNAKVFLEENGFQVELAPHCLGQHNYFSGSDNERCADMQKALDDENIKAIWCARGGYGAVRIVDQLDWTLFQKNPKWLIGFSDITVFHNRLSCYGIPSIHATMPLNLKENSAEALETFKMAISGNKLSYRLPSSQKNVLGKTKAKLIGGNLSIIYSLLATNDNLNFKDKILFIEDVGEQLYSLDRMMFALEKSGVLDQICGLIVGGFTDMKDTAIPFGQNTEEIILSRISGKHFPVSFNFPAGHLDDNRALIFGVEYNYIVQEDHVVLNQL